MLTYSGIWSIYLTCKQTSIFTKILVLMMISFWWKLQPYQHKQAFTWILDPIENLFWYTTLLQLGLSSLFSNTEDCKKQKQEMRIIMKLKSWSSCIDFIEKNTTSAYKNWKYTQRSDCNIKCLKRNTTGCS